MLVWDRLPSSSDPDPLLRVESSGESGRITDNYRVGREASRNKGVGRHHTIATDHEISLTAYDCSAVSNPTALLNSNCATRCETLGLNRQMCVFISVVVIHN